MKLMVYCKQALFELEAPDAWDAQAQLNFRQLINMLRADGYFSWPTPCLYIPTDQIVAMSLTKEGEPEVVRNHPLQDVPQGRPN